MIPPRQPNEWLFPRPARGGGVTHPSRESIRAAIKKALKIPDAERLDTHSLRRAFCADAHRAGVPDDVTRRLTGHETQAMLMHYQRDAVGDDLRAAQAKVAAYRASRRAAGAAPGASPASPASSPASPCVDVVSVRPGGSRTLDGVLVRDTLYR